VSIFSYLRSAKLNLRNFLNLKFLCTFLLVFLIAFILHLEWRKWLLSVPQPLPQVSTIPFKERDSLQQGEYYEISVPPTGAAKYVSADYRIWIPNGVQTIRSLIVKQHGCGGDPSKEMGLVYANDLQWQALAIKHQSALLGSKYPGNCNNWGNINLGSEDAFLNALNNFAQKTRHPELAKLPWILWGYSAGADWVIQMSQKYPDRTIAVVAMRCGGVHTSLSEPNSKFLTSDINPLVLEVPTMFAVGDQDKGNFDECVSLPKKVFSRFRKASALWTFAVEANADHGSTDTRLLAIPYLDEILTLRLTTDSGKLSQIDESKGWLANPSTLEISPASQYKGDPLEASWLPDKETAYRWKEYNTTPSLWNQVRYKVCSNKILATLLNAPYLTESCYPDKILPTKSPAVPTDVRALQVGETEALLTWNFTPDLENGLPQFRIYRNNLMIATLQGQEHNNSDGPEPSHVVLEFRDKETIPKAIYTISAFNALGENVSQSTQIVKEK